MALTRLQKIIAQAGVASRRHAERMIEEGRVRVNGKVVTAAGEKADPRKDKIEVNGQLLIAERPMTVLMNKPRGVVSTSSDPEGRETVVDLVKKIKTRLYPVGRLDYATSGALLLTNDGDLAYALTHPKHGVEKTYLIKVSGKVPKGALQKWRDGVDIGDVVTQPAVVFRAEETANFTWIQVTIKEGRNRQIRRMGEATNLRINKLKRVSFAGLTIQGLAPGEYRELNDQDLSRLKRDYINPVKNAKSKTAPKSPHNGPGAARVPKTRTRRPQSPARKRNKT
jgi:23S rRNA pseudouridine2605 synthase